MNKRAVIDALRQGIDADLEALANVTADARDEATGSESKAEDKYDTRATEASYLAAGQGRRLLATRQLAAWLDEVSPTAAPPRVTTGALVELTPPRGPTRWVLVGPVGGPRVTVDGQVVSLISLQSPLGEELEDAEPGDVVEIDSPRGPMELRVHSIQ